ncbi:MAG: nucleotidyl transferase AbiEii/AbiGii toxin family protein [Candidatus Omnitrophica bacterium]|nr:nucleotidyl transferase AbiEii/AbiGii toxin family protein [Candidatus Omnitrophota bacterium]
MFEQVLPGNTKAILALLEKSEIVQKAYLAGGTALALQLGHRISYDLDFFTTDEFDENNLLPKLKEISKFELERTAWRTVLGNFEGVRFSIFYYEYPLLHSTRKFGKVNILDIRDIAAMKIAAIASRGVKRDFIDFYFICQEGISLDEAIRLYDKKYKNLATTSVHIMKSLVYFEDAEKDPMPNMLKPCKWEEVKRFFEREVKKITIKALKK